MGNAIWADWEYPFRLKGQQGEGEKMVRDVAHDYAQNKLPPLVLTAFQTKTLDRTVMYGIGDLEFWVQLDRSC